MQRELQLIDEKINCNFFKLWPHSKKEKMKSIGEYSEFLEETDVNGMYIAPEVWNTMEDIYACQLGSSEGCRYIADRALDNLVQLPQDIQQSIKEIKSMPVLKILIS